MACTVAAGFALANALLLAWASGQVGEAIANLVKAREGRSCHPMDWAREPLWEKHWFAWSSLRRG